jgi:hypothetical protein
VTQATISALPNAILALLTGGGSVVAQGTSGLQALSTAETTTGLLPTLSLTMQTMLKNPMFWASFAQSAGSNYENAKESEASEPLAQISAILSGFLTAALEGGYGLETLPSKLAQNTSVFRKLRDSVIEGGNEGVIQGVIEKLIAKLFYAPETPFASMTDQNAVINPKRAAQEYGTGAMVSGLMKGSELFESSRLGANTKLSEPYQSEIQKNINELGTETKLPRAENNLGPKLPKVKSDSRDLK